MKNIKLIYLFLSLGFYASSQNNGIYLKLNHHHLEDLHFFILEDETLDLDIRKLRQVQSFQFGINKDLKILKNLFLVAAVGLKIFQRPMSDRHRIPGSDTIFNNIKLRVSYLSSSLSIQYSINKFSLAMGYTSEFDIQRKLIADGAVYNFKGQDWADGFYKRINLLFAQLNLSVSKRWSVFLSGAMHTEQQKNIYFISLADFVYKQSQFSVGVQYDIWGRKNSVF